VLLWGLFVGAAAAVLAPIGPGALVPLKMAVSAADSVGSDVYVAVVVDFGNGTTKTWCVPVAPTARDTDALAAAVGSSNVSYSSSGLLCAINGVPSNGVQNCGQSVGNGNYDFWSYWHGSTGKWTYADNGPAGESVSNPADDVEGWKFQVNEPASSNDPPPGLAPSYAQICNGVPTTTATTTTSGGAPAAPGSAPAASGSTPTTAESPAGSGGATPTSSPVATRSKAGTPGVPASSTTTTVGAAGAAGRAGAASATTTSVSGGSSGADGGSHGSSDARRIAESSAAAHGGSGGSPSDVLPGVLVGVVVVALAAFALLRWRRRPAEE
jgi:hypothetical protein